MSFQLKTYQESFDLLAPFKIAHGTRYTSDMVVVEISENGVTGMGESFPYKRYNETFESVIAQIEEVRAEIKKGITREELQELMPYGAARNAVDLALWDLESKQTGTPIWKLAGLPEPKVINTAYTLVINEPEEMGKQAGDCDYPILKLKLAGDGKDGERMHAVRKARPDAKIVIDANESWDKANYNDSIKICEEVGISMVEQPVKQSEDEILRNLPRPITICADESCHVTADLEGLVGKYDMVNIKLDKTGGLTEAIKLMKKARELGFQVMVGCMVGTSLAIKPAYYLGHLADFVDIDGPMLLKNDRKGILNYNGVAVSEVA